MVARNQRMAGGRIMDAVVEYRNDQPDEQENDRLDHLFCELRGLREDLRFLRMLSTSQGRRIDDIMEQFEPKPSALARSRAIRLLPRSQSRLFWSRSSASHTVRSDLGLPKTMPSKKKSASSKRRRYSRAARCPHCKLRQAKRKRATCPKDTAKRCKCCDHCRRECWIDAKV